MWPVTAEIEALFWTLVVLIPLMALGLWLNGRGVLRARHLFYRFQPVVFTVANFIYITKAELAPSWWVSLLLSILGAALITFGMFVIWRMAVVDVDEIDRAWNKKR
jgi:hypothetical protein